MGKIQHEFHASTLGKHYYIYEENGNSGICTCGHHDLNIDRIIGVKECPQCHTKAIIFIRAYDGGNHKTYERVLNYIAFNENEFKIIIKQIEIKLFINIVVIDNKPTYKIKEGSLETVINDYEDLHFYYNINKKGNKTIKSELYLKGEKTNLLAGNCPSIYGVQLIPDETKRHLRTLSIDRYNSSDIWKVYSFYKHGKNLFEKGHVGFKGSVSEIQTLNRLSISEEIGPIFNKMVEYYKYVRNEKSVEYWSFSNVFGYSTSYYNPAIFKSDYIKFVLNIDKDVIKAALPSVHNISHILHVFQLLNFNSEETEEFLKAAFRQNIPLHFLSGSKIVMTATLLNKCNARIDKRIKDVRIFIDLLNMFNAFETYVYSKEKYKLKSNNDLSIEYLCYQDKVIEVYNFVYKYRENAIPAIAELLVEKQRYSLDFTLLYKNDKLIEDCIVMINGDKEIHKILYKEVIFDDKNEIQEFLDTISNEGLGYAV